MPGSVLDIESFIQPDSLGCEIAGYWHTWNMLRQEWVKQQLELRKYIYAVDTRTTTNATLPWKNTTTIPKLCQIRDNLIANYMKRLYPKEKWLKWDAYRKDHDTREKSKAITGYMCSVVEQRDYKLESRKLITDYVEAGNAFAMPEWLDDRVEVQDRSGKTQVGYVGPSLRRISPQDIVFNPVAESFDKSPKIIRSIVSMGEVKDFLRRLSNDDNREAYEALWKYMKEFRNNVSQHSGEVTFKNEALRVDGFSNYNQYIAQNVAEILTFYGDIYDRNSDTFLKNHIIMVVDRHKVIDMRPNPSFFGTPPVRHIGWRVRQDNLWAMGPLANLVGMQYRVDHLENLKADCFDLIAFPPLKIKGYVRDFKWEPFAKIITDEDGDVEIMAPPWNVLTVNQEIAGLLALMEEMAGSPREAMGFRTPGEKTKYEVQRLENAADRIFQSKADQYEEQFEEPLLNDLLELGRRKTTSDILIKYYDDEYDINRFLDLTVEDISGHGRIRPYASRHFAEEAETIQNLNSFFSSPIGQDPGVRAHWSTIKLSKFFEEKFGIQDYGIVLPYVRMAEEADAQRLANAQAEKVMEEALIASGLNPEDIQNAAPPQAPPQQAAPAAPQEPAPTPTSPFTQGQGYPNQ